MRVGMNVTPTSDAAASSDHGHDYPSEPVDIFYRLRRPRRCMWVRSEYAGELAVLSAWLCALLPWSVSYANPGAVHLVRVHFLYAFFQFAPGSGLSELIDTVVVVADGPSFAANATVEFGYQLWVLGAILLTLAVALSLVYYRYDERLEARSPVDPVRVMGGLLFGAAFPLAGATYFVHSGGRGVTVPVGVLFMLVLGGLLLLVERTDDAAEARDALSEGPTSRTEDDVSD